MNVPASTQPIWFLARAVHGRRVGGQHVLVFTAACLCRDPGVSTAVVRHDFTELSANGVYVGLATPLDVLRPGKTVDAPTSVDFVAELSSAELHMIEHVRQGQGVDLTLFIVGELEGPDGPRSIEASLAYPVTAQAWSSCLEQMDYRPTAG